MDRACLDRALARVPHYMREGVLEYLCEGIPPGEFLRAVLENDLHRAGLKADDNNQKSLIGWAAVLDALPMNVWGSRAKVDAHIEYHRKLRAAPTYYECPNCGYVDTRAGFSVRGMSMTCGDCGRSSAVSAFKTRERGEASCKK